MNLGPEEVMEAAGLYPERPGELDCSYYIRTGLCKFGMTCKFNHPPNRKLAVAAARSRGVYPERPGQPECQYYLKTGTCKFGATCKFHHPSIAGRVQLNSLGYPIRPSEQECNYYLRTGLCKFGSTCKFHHPPPSSAMPSSRGSLIYSNVPSPTSSGQQSFTGLANWSLSRPSFIASPRWQSPSSFTQLILPQGLVQVPGWNAYTGQMGSVPSESQQGSNQGPFSSFRTNSVPMGQYRQQRESIFPERPGEPECQFYMKTGDCKFGATCKFHHPRERAVPIPDCLLNPLGLPLRPGEPLCVFYSRYGICKFGPNCKFDHPYGTTYAYGYSPSAEGPAVHHSFGSSSGNGERSTEAGPGKSRRVLLAEPQQMAAVDRSNLMDGSHGTASAGPISSFS